MNLELKILISVDFKVKTPPRISIPSRVIEDN
jgi:hypothetical protein